MSSRSKWLRLLGLAAALVLLGAAALLVGPVSHPSWLIIREIRLPRVILAILVGFGLSGAGAVLQGALRNPLADPFILGTSSAATAGVILAGILGLEHYAALYILALGFGLLSIFLVYRMASREGKTPVQTVILAGVIVSLFFNALVFLFFSIFYRESFTVLYFLLGTLSAGEPTPMIISGTIILAGLVATWGLARELNLLTQGERTAHHLGADVEATKRLLFFTSSAMVAAAVAVAGMIGFVGLIVPHMMRFLIGPDHRFLIPASALGGALFLIAADALARILVPPLEIPVGAVTALVGCPYFVYLLRRHQHSGEF